MLHRGILVTLLVGGMMAAVAAGYQAASAETAASPKAGWTAAGYHLQLVADQLSAPVGIAVGERDQLFIAEAGTAPGTQPRVLAVRGPKARKTLASDFPAPLTGIIWHKGKLYVAYRGGVDLLDPATGLHHPILSKLPAQGDYPNGALAIGPDDQLYIGIGSATNAGVVGVDNIQRGWVKLHPDARDIPCAEVTLKGTNFSVANPLTPEPQDMAATGAFSPFGKTTARLQTIPGALPCTGAILRANLDGTSLGLVAWGLRHPAGLAFGPDRQLYATLQGFEDRGSRPVPNDREYLYRIDEGRWYGWPDYAGGVPVTAEQFQKPSMPVTALLASPPGEPPSPVTSFPSGSDPAGLVFPSDRFGVRGEALVALSGPKGGTVVRVNPRTGTVTPFASRSQPGAIPVALAAAPDGSIYLADQGVAASADPGSGSRPGSGSVWRITPNRPARGTRPHEVHWQWALVGMVLSLAGLNLVKRPD